VVQRQDIKGSSQSCKKRVVRATGLLTKKCTGVAGGTFFEIKVFRRNPVILVVRQWAKE